MNIRITYYYKNVTMRQVEDAFKYVAKFKIPDGARGFFPAWLKTDEEYIAAKYEGEPYINGRGNFEEACKTVNRFLYATGKIENEQPYRHSERVYFYK